MWLFWDNPVSPLHMKSEEGKPFLVGDPLFHTDATDKESPGYLGFPTLL